MFTFNDSLDVYCFEMKYIKKWYIVIYYFKFNIEIIKTSYNVPFEFNLL